MHFFEGFSLGLATVFLVGPVFFYLLQTSIEYGFKAGLSVVLGIFMGDLIFALTLFYGIGNLELNPESKWYVSIFGSALLCFLGFRFLLKKNLDSSAEIKLQPLHFTGFLFKGFLINFVNPFVVFIWIGFVGYAFETYKDRDEVLFCLSGILFGIVSTDIFKVFASKFIRPHFTFKIRRVVNILFGFLLIFFGIRMIWVNL